MEFELIKEKIILDSAVGEETSQVMLEGDIIVPDIKPDIAKILQCKGKIMLDGTNLSNDKVCFDGKVEFSLLYLSDDAEKTLHNMISSLEINDCINIDGVDRECNVRLNCEIIHLDCKMINGRKIHIKALVEVCAKAIKEIISEVVTEIRGIEKVQLEKASLNVNRTVENKEDKIYIKDEVTVPAGKPNIREILLCEANITDKECKLSNGSMNVKGTVVLSTLYKSEMDENTVEFVEYEIPFNGMLEASRSMENMIGDVSLSVQSQYVQIRSDADGEQRALDIELALLAKLNVISSEDVQVIEDAYCINKKLVLEREKIKYPQLICKNKNQSSIKETVVLEPDLPEIMQIYSVSGRAKLDELSVEDGRVVAEGIIISDILYVAKSDEAPLYSYQSVIPFKQAIETRGTTSKMKVDVDLAVEHTGFNMLSTNEVEVRFILNFNTQVTGENEVELIADAYLEDIDAELADIASMIIYVVQTGDTLWKIAKRFNTSIEQIAMLNEIENPNKIFPGQKLLLVKNNAE